MDLQRGKIARQLQPHLGMLVAIFHLAQRIRNHAGKFRIDQDDLGAAMVQLKCD